MKRLLCVLICVLLPGLAVAKGGIDTARESVEASMLVTGLIAINPNGNVYGYSLDQRDKLPGEVVKLINATVSDWQFEPVKIDGKPVLAKALMSLRIVARQNQPGHFVASIEGAAFGDAAEQSGSSSECAHDACLSYAMRRPPAYPLDLVRQRVSGTVYVVVEVNRRGQVAQAAVQQVDLVTLADETEMNRWRSELSKATLNAVNGWTFNIPKTGKGAQRDRWFVSIPINYVFSPASPKYGQWNSYVPGPVQPLPWVADSKRTAENDSANAIPDDGQPFVLDSRFVLLTPLGEGLTPPQSPGNPTRG